VDFGFSNLAWILRTPGSESGLIAGRLFYKYNPKSLAGQLFAAQEDLASFVISFSSGTNA
jgi:hypothetical protein